jgi:hypothetical protein
MFEFHEKPANGSVADTCSRTDGLMDGCVKRKVNVYLSSLIMKVLDHVYVLG